MFVSSTLVFWHLVLLKLDTEIDKYTNKQIQKSKQKLQKARGLKILSKSLEQSFKDDRCGSLVGLFRKVPWLHFNAHIRTQTLEM